jgi:putative endopeptidase
VALLATLGASTSAGPAVPESPGFSTNHMDFSVRPADDFFRYAAGSWVRNNPVPADKSRWTGFIQLQERNWHFIREILKESSTNRNAGTALRQVGDFYRAAIDTNRLEKLRFEAIAHDLKRIAALKEDRDLLGLLADFHRRGIRPCFNVDVRPDAKQSDVYALHLGQGGLSLPDRDYYLQESFSKQLQAFREHIARMLQLLGLPEAQAKHEAAMVVEIETALAQASKSRVELRDSVANYNKFSVGQITAEYPDLPLAGYLKAIGAGPIQEVIIGQPAFLQAMYGLLLDRPLDDWKIYLKWHTLNNAAPYLHAAAEDESFAFYGKILRDQQVPEPRWQRGARFIDGSIGEALGQLYVARYFPPQARQRMAELVENIKVVFRDRLTKLDWMTPATREKGLAKFERFTQKIGHPEQFRDYSAVEIRPDDLLGNVQRAHAFEVRRRLARVGQPVDKTEWNMTPQTVNAYFSGTQNEIVFPAGILQPPFFDPALDDAVNYGAIGVVIGHEITHGYDDQGRKFDANGNLNDWWQEADREAFEARAKRVVDQYSAYEALPGLPLNGQLTLGENIADLGGTSIAYEALQRALEKDPVKRKKIDGLTPEQRFFISLSQMWRINCRDAEIRRLVTVDPHSPGQFRAIGAHVNMAEFFRAFSIKEGDKMWRAPEERSKIW